MINLFLSFEALSILKICQVAAPCRLLTKDVKNADRLRQISIIHRQKYENTTVVSQDHGGLITVK